MEDESDQEEEHPEDHGVPSCSESDAESHDEPRKRRKRRAAQALGSNIRNFADLNDDHIAFMDFKELTRLMNSAGLTRAEITEVKARRRRLKNRQSARLCSNKKRELCTELSSEKSKLQDQLTALQKAHAQLQQTCANLRQQLANKRLRE